MSVIKENIRLAGTYKPPLDGRRESGLLRLDFNERTTPVSAEIERALSDFAKSKLLQVYPSYGGLTSRLAKQANVKDSQLMFTNGSDQGIELVFRSVCEKGDRVIIPAPSFAMYLQCATIEDLEVCEPAYSRENGYPLEEVLQLANERTRLIVVSNPNNPTGTAVPLSDIERLAAEVPQAAILIDECYLEYCGVNAAGLIEKYNNIFICRTFSKTWGLPSIRLGTLISNAQNIEDLCKVRGPYDVNQFAEVAINAALDKPEYTQSYIEEVMQIAKPKLEAYLGNKNIDFWPSSANFILTIPKNAQKLAEQLAEKKILVRPKQDPSGALGLRITIGTEEQMDRLILALEELI